MEIPVLATAFIMLSFPKFSTVLINYPNQICEMRKLIFLTTFLLSATIGFGQIPDSIAFVLKDFRQTPYPERFDRLDSLINKTRNDVPLSLKISEDELAWVLAHSEGPLATTWLHTNIAHAQMSLEKYDNAMDHLLKAKSLTLEHDDNSAEWSLIAAKTSKVMSRVYSVKGDTEKAHDEMVKAIDLFEVAKDTQSLITSYAIFGNILNHQEKFQQSIYYLEKCCDYAGAVSIAESDLDGCIYMLVNAYWSQDENIKARDLLRKNVDEMISAKPINEGVFIVMKAQSEVKAGNQQAAFNILKPLVDSIDNHKGAAGYPVKKHVLKNYVDVLHGLGRDAETKPYYQKILNFQETYDKELRESSLANSELKIKTLEDEQRIKDLEANEILASAKLKSTVFGLLSVFGILFAVAGFWFYRQRQKERAELLLNAKEKETQKVREKLLTSITHELRTPLSIISAKLESLEETKNGEQKTEHLNVAKRNTKQLVDQINQLLEWNKLEANALTNRPTTGDIDMVLLQILDEMKSSAVLKNIDWQLDIKKQNYNGKLDYAKFETIAKNLLSNAIKYSPTNSQIELKLHQENNQIIFEVQDAGPGIPKEDLTKIFDWYYRVSSDKNEARYEGFGIGLALSKELAELMGGNLTVQSENGNGTTFFLNVPFEIINSTKGSTFGNTVTPIPNADSDILKSDESTLLVIEDHPDLAAHIASLFRSDFEVLVAQNLKEGKQLAEQQVPDIIISDVMLPDGSGLDLCQELKSHIVTNHIPILVLTAKAGEETKFTSLKSGADAFLNKPFRNEELQLTVKNLLQNRRRLHLKFGNQSESATIAPDPFSKMVLEVLEANYSNSHFTLVDFAKALHISKGQAYKKFKATFNNTPANLLRDFRLEKGKQMLEQKDMKIGEIAYACGFTSPEYFSTVFKEFYKESPSVWRR